MNATEALKQARELLGRLANVAAHARRICDLETGCDFCDVEALDAARAFLTLPSPVEEGTWNEAVETAAKVALDADVPGYEWTGAVLISGRIRRLRRDTSKPEEKRYTWGEIETMLLASFPRFGLSRADMPDLRAALTGERPGCEMCAEGVRRMAGRAAYAWTCTKCGVQHKPG